MCIRDSSKPLNLTTHNRAWLSSYNFGRLLIRSFENVATEQELAWLGLWHNELNVARGAMAYDCYDSHPEIQQNFRCLVDGATCANDNGDWDMSHMTKLA
eukprot:TRINITY_DN6509_c0_g1_i1.p1 TRINITY_DN6509_c0_g1~~TRINITY_DN6509_c0_g1_i1.p1  ORF type:complete len:100 (+),score=34.06 TRINITY_DN6509_c0_g1_i1:145-444(+)